MKPLSCFERKIELRPGGDPVEVRSQRANTVNRGAFVSVGGHGPFFVAAILDPAQARELADALRAAADFAEGKEESK